MPWTGFGEFDQQLLQHFCYLVVDVFRTVIRMKPQDDERESIQQLPDDREHVRLADLLAGGDELHLRHAVHRIDVIHALDAVHVALMHAVYADVARHAVRLRGTAFADGNTRRIPVVISKISGRDIQDHLIEESCCPSQQISIMYLA